MLKGQLYLLGKPRYYFVFLAFLLLLLVILLTTNAFYLNILFMILLFAGLSGAWNIIGGFSGQLSLGHAAFFGIGAYTSSLLFVKCGIPPLLGTIASAGIALVLALIIGFPCFRLKGPFFTLATIAIAEVLQLLAVHFRDLTDGSEGLSIPFHPSFLNLTFESKTKYALTAYVFMLIVLGISSWIKRSKLGYQLAALAEEDQAAEALGVDTTKAKMLAFLISAGLTAVGATIYAQYLLFIEPHSEFSISVSIDLALISMVGGLGTTVGPVIGSFLLIPLQEFLRGWLGGIYQGLHFVIYGALLVAVVMFMRRGIIAFFSDKYDLVISKLPTFFGVGRYAPLPPALETGISSFLLRPSKAHDRKQDMKPIIEIHRISKNFGGLKALSNLSLSVREGEIFGIIGPNGAGKTTLFNVLSAMYKPDAGVVRFKDRTISNLSKSHLVCRSGIGRTFQLVKPFENMSVLENVMVGAFSQEHSREKVEEISLQVLDFVELASKKEMLAHELTLADKKRLEVARVLATRPQLLLLDEVMAGLNPAEVSETSQLVTRIRDYGITVIIIEHVMQAIMALSDKVMVLAEGEKITEGAPEEVVKDIRVIKAYLGEGDELA
jgi:branched-chain amino acid transport system permease protein